ncbi:MAG TPA: PilZ domain-containing protein [Pyrinomonadaceae bacterium]|nr:PilZ domain-containing protein [Pyrinomonadaceae bacterium]
MTPSDHSANYERRRFPRYHISARMTLAIEDESLRESIGLGEPGDISLGGLRVRNLPACPNVKVGARLGLLLMDQADALSLHAEVVHHGSPDTFGVEFRELSPTDARGVRGIIERLHPIV